MNISQQPNILIPQPFNVNKVIRETDDTFTLDLCQGANPIPMEFSPGQFNMLYAFGVGEVPISISGISSSSGGWLHTIRDVGTVTRVLHRLKKGNAVGVRGPFGTPWPVKETKGRDVVIIAGGIGLAPLRPLLHEIQLKRETMNEVALLYGARTPESLLFSRDREAWRNRHRIQVKVTVDVAGRDWKSNVGVVTHLIPRVTFDPANTVVFICGPEVMMRYSVIELIRLGVPEERIYISMERNMKCAVGFCGHCQFGPSFVCKDGPVFPYSHIRKLFDVREY